MQRVDGVGEGHVGTPAETKPSLLARLELEYFPDMIVRLDSAAQHEMRSCWLVVSQRLRIW